MNFVTLNDSCITLQEIQEIVLGITKNCDCGIIHKKNNTIQNVEHFNKAEYQLYELLKIALYKGEKFTIDNNSDALSADIQLKSIMDFLKNKDAVLLRNIELHFCYKKMDFSDVNYSVLFRIKSETTNDNELCLKITIGDLYQIQKADECCDMLSELENE